MNPEGLYQCRCFPYKSKVIFFFIQPLIIKFSDPLTSVIFHRESRYNSYSHDFMLSHRVTL